MIRGRSSDQLDLFGQDFPERINIKFTIGHIKEVQAFQGCQFSGKNRQPVLAQVQVVQVLHPGKSGGQGLPSHVPKGQGPQSGQMDKRFGPIGQRVFGQVQYFQLLQI